MNTKIVLAVLFSLVSVSLCDIPAPSQELVDKYDAYKATFLKRLLNVYNKMQEAAVPMMADNNDGMQVIKDYAEDLQSKPQFQAAVKVATGLGAEAGPLVDKARTSLLGLYEQYMRPHVGEQLSNFIDELKVYLDKFMPAE